MLHLILIPMLTINSCVAMQVFVRNPNPEGNPPTIGLEVGPDATVDDLARDIYNQYGRAYDLTLGGERLDAGSTLADAGVTAEAELGAVLQEEDLYGGDPLFYLDVTVREMPPRREDAPSPSAPPPQHRLRIAGQTKPSAPPHPGMIMVTVTKKPSAPPKPSVTRVTATGIKA